MARPYRPVRKKKLGDYPSPMVVSSTTLALLIIGLFGLLLLHANRLAARVRQSLEVQVYLQPDMTELQRLRVEQALKASAFVAFNEETGQPALRFVSREAAARDMIAQTGEDFQQFLGENPLPDAYTLRLTAEASADTVHLRRAVRSLRMLDGVADVNYVERLIDSVNQNLRRVSLVLLGFALVLTLVVVVLVNNTVKLALFSQRFLIRTMQLVGASEEFIQGPFLRRAAGQGLVSGLLAGLLLLATEQWAVIQLPELGILRDDLRLLALLAGLVALGGLLGLLSAWRAVRRYLHLSLDELY
ncbi:MAG: ABC transporter permease [Hymenobacteraceae bacterium]|nr:ABC transporter permease [Hymenobacteraceae bacterium]